MIKLGESEIAQILPAYLKQSPEAVAISYAIKKAIQKTVEYSKLISVYAAIDSLPEEILDLLAVELRTQYYDQSLSVERKRQMVKMTMMWFRYAGTPKAVQELVETVFGIGDVLEWFEYGGEPYRFKVITNADAKYESIEEFEKIIKKVKNSRSHLEKVEFSKPDEMKLYMGIKVVPLVEAITFVEE